jgi:hypothetical protein
MAELGTPARYNLPASRLNIQRFPFPQEAPRLPIPAEDAILARGELVGAGIMATAEEKAAASRAQLIANIGNMLATLPQKVEESYWKGRENAVRRKGLDLQSQLLGGDLSGVSKLPPGATLRPDGSVSYTPQTEEDRLRLQILRQRAIPEVDPYEAMQRRWETPLAPTTAPGGVLATPEWEAPTSLTAPAAGTENIAEQAAMLGKELSATYGGRFEHWADRDIRGMPGVKSKHATGEAIDYYNTPEAMPAIAEELANPATAKRVIFNHRIWEPETGWRPYKGAHGHEDHIHVEPVLRTSAVIPTEEVSLAPIGSGEATTSTTAAALGAPPLASPRVLRPLGGIGRNPATGGFVAPLSPTQAVETTPGKQRLVEVPFNAGVNSLAAKMDEKLALEGYDVANMTPEQKQETLRSLSGGKRLTEGEQKTSIYLGRSEAANQNLDKILEKFDPTSLEGSLKTKGVGTPFNPLAGADAQRFRQASLEFISAVLRKDSGATITAKEEEMANQTWIPQFGDTKETLGQKADARRRAVQELRDTLPQKAANKAAPGTAAAAAPIVVSDSTEKAPIIITNRAQYDALKSGQYYIYNGRPGLKK